MRLVDQEYIEEKIKSEKFILKNFGVEKYTDLEIDKMAKESVLKFRPQGQVKLFNGYGIASLVDIATGKELDRWETR